MEAVQSASAPVSTRASRLTAQVGVVAAVVVMLACMGVLFAAQFNSAANAATNSNGTTIGAAK